MSEYMEVSKRCGAYLTTSSYSVKGAIYSVKGAIYGVGILWGNERKHLWVGVHGHLWTKRLT